MQFPDGLLDWLRQHPIDLDPDDRSYTIWAEWDSARSELHLGFWARPVCPRCGQHDQPQQSLIVPRGFVDNNWQHGCGYWWRPVDIAANLADKSKSDVTALLNEALAGIRGMQDAAREQVRRDLLIDLRMVLSWPVEARARLSRATETEPGVWIHEGKWEAWAYDPVMLGETITVTEDDLEDTA